MLSTIGTAHVHQQELPEGEGTRVCRLQSPACLGDNLLSSLLSIAFRQGAGPSCAFDWFTQLG